MKLKGRNTACAWSPGRGFSSSRLPKSLLNELHMRATTSPTGRTTSPKLRSHDEEKLAATQSQVGSRVKQIQPSHHSLNR